MPVLIDQVARWDAQAPERQTADIAPATKRALQALGYLEEEEEEEEQEASP